MQPNRSPEASMHMPQQLAVVLTQYFGDYPHTHVLETGTYLGLGSTRMLAEAARYNHLTPEFITIERNWSSWRKARKHLSEFSFVKPLWGNTLKESEAMAFLQSDDFLQRHEERPDVLIDDVADPIGFYQREIQGQLGATVPHWKRPLRVLNKFLFFQGEDLLRKYLTKFKKHNPFIVLDSAGGIGYLEFQVLQRIMHNYPYTVLLDDINHLKHVRSYASAKLDPRYTEITKDNGGRWALLQYKPKQNIDTSE